MDRSSDSDQPIEIGLLRSRLSALRRSVDEMEDLLDRYITSEHALRESEERFRLLVEEVKDYAIFMLDPLGNITSWNVGAQRIKGYHASEIIGRHFSVFYLPEEVAAQKPAWELDIARAEGRYEEEGWRVRKDGTLFWANVLITALYDSSGRLRGFGKVTRDMTDRKRAAEEREQLREREYQLSLEREERAHAEKLVRLREEFLTIAAHELRTPLTSLLGNAQLLQRRAQRDGAFSEGAQKNVKVIVDQASRMNKMLVTMLDLSGLQIGQLSVGRASLDLVALVRRIVEEVGPTLKHHTITYVGPNAPLLIEGDAMRLEQVLQNLVQNAIKYSPAGGPIQVQVERHDTMVSVAVTDQGIGIPQEDLPKLFRRFSRASNVSERYISGLGVGLYIVKEIVGLHGGRVEVVSEEGRGSTFTVWLPLLGHRPASDHPEAHGEEQAPASHRQEEAVQAPKERERPATP